MAALTGNNVVKVWEDGVADQLVLYALRNVDTGDTADLSADFQIVKRAVVVGQTVAGAAAATVTAPATITVPAGMTDDAGFLLAYGVHK